MGFYDSVYGVMGSIKYKVFLTSIIFTKYLGAIGGYIVNTSILFFAMATIVGWFHYGDRALFIFI